MRVYTWAATLIISLSTCGVVWAVLDVPEYSCIWAGRNQNYVCEVKRINDSWYPNIFDPHDPQLAEKLQAVVSPKLRHTYDTTEVNNALESQKKRIEQVEQSCKETVRSVIETVPKSIGLAVDSTVRKYLADTLAYLMENDEQFRSTLANALKSLETREAAKVRNREKSKKKE